MELIPNNSKSRTPSFDNQLGPTDQQATELEGMVQLDTEAEATDSATDEVERMNCSSIMKEKAETEGTRNYPRFDMCHPTLLHFQSHLTGVDGGQEVPRLHKR